jgi:DNA-binding transcriptional regulator YiaG
MEDFLILEKDSFDLKAELKSIGMTQKDFAEHIKRTTSTINRWAIGETEMPEIIKLYINNYRQLKACKEFQR